MTGMAETEIEIKQEPLAQNCGEEKNEMELTRFDNNSSMQQSPTNMKSLPSWTSHATACLIKQYKNFYCIVGQTTRLRTRIEMFEIISRELAKHGYFFSPQKCENKWKVLERKYKNLVHRERLKKPGRIKDYGHWEHKRALDEIFDETRKQICSEENDFAVPGASVKFIAQQPVAETNRIVTGDQVAEPLPSSPANSEKSRESPATLETLLVAINDNFARSEVNKERRHKEKMALKQAELEIRRKMLRLKEQKIESCKCQSLFHDELRLRHNQNPLNQHNNDSQ